MEFSRYGKVPNAISEELIKAYQEKRRVENAQK
jgi:hypothetical protein